MAITLAWLLLFLGVAHIAFAAIRFRLPLKEAFADGFVGRFGSPEIRRTAFWFAAFGPLLMLAGHVALRAAESGDLPLYRLVGVYVLVTSVVGVLVAPKSPFLAGLLVSGLIVAASYGYP